MINDKEFLAKNSITSMAAIHIKTYEDERQEYRFRISDCNQTAKIWGKINDSQQLAEGIETMETII